MTPANRSERKSVLLSWGKLGRGRPDNGSYYNSQLDCMWRRESKLGLRGRVELVQRAVLPGSCDMFSATTGLRRQGAPMARIPFKRDRFPVDLIGVERKQSAEFGNLDFIQKAGLSTERTVAALRKLGWRVRIVWERTSTVVATAVS